MSKILVLKNDRAGDLFTSLELISTLIRDEKNVKIRNTFRDISIFILIEKLNHRIQLPQIYFYCSISSETGAVP